jgi:hypothetical protein
MLRSYMMPYQLHRLISIESVGVTVYAKVSKEEAEHI